MAKDAYHHGDLKGALIDAALKAVEQGGAEAVSLRDLGWPGFVQIVTFFLILLVGFVYVWRKGVLDWGSRRRVTTAPRKVA